MKKSREISGLKPEDRHERHTMAVFKCQTCGAIRPFGFSAECGLDYFPVLQCEGGHLSRHIYWEKRKFEILYRVGNHWSGEDGRILQVAFIPVGKEVAA